MHLTMLTAVCGENGYDDGVRVVDADGGVNPDSDSDGGGEASCDDDHCGGGGGGEDDGDGGGVDICADEDGALNVNVRMVMMTMAETGVILLTTAMVLVMEMLAVMVSWH